MSNSNKNIVLTGFMGTGKSAVARVLAKSLGRQLFDIDQKIEEQEGKTIAEIFEDKGEAHFRILESVLCETLATQENCVIAAGGGCFTSPKNRRLLTKSGLVFCLSNTPSVIAKRLEGSKKERPLLATSKCKAPLETRIESMLSDRLPLYQRFFHQIDRKDDGVEETALQIQKLFELHTEIENEDTLFVKPPNAAPYPLCIDSGSIGQVGKYMEWAQLKQGAVFVVSNQKIWDLYGEQLVSGLKANGYEPEFTLIPEGETHKTLGTVESLYQFLSAKGASRHCPLIALGGGVVGDIAGFAAATYMRGMPLVQIPTTLLAMVDSSVGGKVGVDLTSGKNLVGAFKNPELVLVDTETIKSLAVGEFRSGLAEVIKHGIIGQQELFEQLEEGDIGDIAFLVKTAVQVKKSIVQKDPYELNIRAYLNLGHTFGHAIETVNHYKMRHGDAVSIGLVASAKLALLLGKCEESWPKRIAKCLQAWGLPTKLEGHSPEAVYAAMDQDKKKVGKILRFVIPEGFGKISVIDNPGKELVLQALAQ